MPMKLKRRTVLLGGIGGAAAVAAGLKPRDHGENHSPYFSDLSTALDAVPAVGPTLVVDRQKLLANIATLKSHIGDRFHYRIVAKSLPSIGLLQTIMSAADSNRLMLFHQPFLSQVATELPASDVLMGKPMPVSAAAAFYKTHRYSEFDHEQQLQWLLDTPRRLQQYAGLADSLELGIAHQYRNRRWPAPRWGAK